jgi:hypothetical protein
MDFEGEMVQEDGFVSFEQEPVLDLPYCVLLPLGLFVFLRNRLIDVLLLALVCISRLHHRNLLLIMVRQLNLLDHLLVLKIYSVHLGTHLELVLRSLLSQRHRTVYIIRIFVFCREHLKSKNLLPTYALFWRVFQHRLEQFLKSVSRQFLGETDDLFVDFGDEFLQRSGLVRSLTEKHLIKDDSHRPHIALG